MCEKEEIEEQQSSEFITSGRLCMTLDDNHVDIQHEVYDCLLRCVCVMLMSSL